MTRAPGRRGSLPAPPGICRSAPGRRGLTLLEIVVALSIMTVVVIVVLKMFPFGRAIMAQASHRFQAGRLAAARLETLRATPWLSLAPGNRTTQTTLPDGLPATLTETVTSVNDGSVEAWREVHVIVAWCEPALSPSVNALDYREEVSSLVGRI